MIAQSLMSEAGEAPDPAAARSLLEHAAKQLMKADSTFERLSGHALGQSAPGAPPPALRCHPIAMREHREFPQDDAACIAMAVDQDVRFEILGWPDRVGFVLRCMLEHLLALRSSKGRVEIAGSLDSSRSLCLTLRLKNTTARRPATINQPDASGAGPAPGPGNGELGSGQPSIDRSAAQRRSQLRAGPGHSGFRVVLQPQPAERS